MATNRSETNGTSTAEANGTAVEYPVIHFKLIESFGGKRLDTPHGVALTPNGDIMVADRNNKKVQFFTWSCRYMTKLNLVEDPVDLIPISHGRFAITDYKNSLVYIVTQDGKIVKKIGNGILKGPIGITTSEEKTIIFVVDSDDSCIRVFNTQGKQIKVIGSHGNEEGQLNLPSYITINSKSELIVSDTGNSRVQIFTSEGNFVHSFGEDPEFADFFGNITGIAVDVHDNIYISGEDRVNMFSPGGKFICRVDSEDDMLGTPIGIDITKRIPSEVVVSDSVNNRIRIYEQEF
ncbi:putative peptidyl-glycine alpha-amidating monooxygenase pamn-1 [Glandiceps talaboti]